jgi:hypothetical protein
LRARFAALSLGTCPRPATPDCARAAACCSEHRCPRALAALPRQSRSAQPGRGVASQRNCAHTATLSTLSPRGGGSAARTRCSPRTPPPRIPSSPRTRP